MSKKVKIMFVLPEGLQRELKERITKDGYDLKGKSRWISEAVESLLSLKTYVDLIKLNDEMKGFTKAESVSVDASLKNKINQAVIDVRQKYLAIEGVQSRILRTAILHRLLIN